MVDFASVSYLLADKGLQGYYYMVVYLMIVLEIEPQVKRLVVEREGEVDALGSRELTRSREGVDHALGVSSEESRSGADLLSKSITLLDGCCIRWPACDVHLSLTTAVDLLGGTGTGMSTLVSSQAHTSVGTNTMTRLDCSIANRRSVGAKGSLNISKAISRSRRLCNRLAP